MRRESRIESIYSPIKDDLDIVKCVMPQHHATDPSGVCCQQGPTMG
jgi:hypothetical protein